MIYKKEIEMSGIFGVIDPQKPQSINGLWNRMGKSMTHRDWYVVEGYEDREQGVALGRMGIGIFNKTSQPVWNAGKTMALMMAGEIYNKPALVKKLSDEEYILTLYEKKGETFVKDLNGVFIAAIWDKKRRCLHIVNDRLGLYPLYYGSHRGRFLFAPEMKGILCDKDFPRKLDMTALAQYMRFQQLLGPRTFFEDIHQIRHAVVLTYDMNMASFTLKPYWSFDDLDYRADISFKEAVEKGGSLLFDAVQHLSRDDHRYGIYLSGGMDSRTVLGMIERRPLVSLTYGVQNSRDVCYAERSAKAAGSDHHWFDLPDGKWVEENIDFHLNLTEGFHSWIHSQGINTLPEARKLTDVTVAGWDGGWVTGVGFFYEPLLVSAVDDMAFISRLFYLLNQEFAWPSITDAEERVLYTGTVLYQVQGLAFESFKEEVTPFLKYPKDLRAQFFYFWSHVMRSTMNLNTVIRSHAEVRFPYFKNEVFEFLSSLPGEVRGDRMLHRAILRRWAPRLARIPYAKDDFLPTDRRMLRNVHSILVKLKRRFNRHLFPLFPEKNTLYADFGEYLRTDIREWAEKILFNKHTLERGIFDPKFLRSLMDRHIAGREEWTIGKIAPIISYELMLRRLYD
jgi:asparagine synthase (glutamine-hydrolysing)